MTWIILVLEISVVMAFGFVLGRVWPSVDEVRSVWMADYENEMRDFTPLPIGRVIYEEEPGR